ncbi:MAG: SprT family zinc-dependent metalloprotease [Candidatus Thioglobus sp.]|jgi:predicted metal-dependent hydrolase
MSTNTSIIKLNDLNVEVVHKDIKNVHLSVYPPNGHVRLSAPEGITLENLRIFVISKLNWIKKQKTKLLSQERESIRDCVNRESHYFNGKRYLLTVIEANEPPKVRLSHSKLTLQVRPGSSAIKKVQVLDEWYRKQLQDALPSIINKWEKVLDVSISKVSVRKMKTRWGSCTPENNHIRINLELAKKPLGCLEYIVVHEMIHLIEPTHNHKFIELMDKYMPKWRFYRDELNLLPVRHDDWKY